MSGVIAGLVLSAGGSGISISQASKQRKLIRQAEEEAEAAMERARKMINTNYLEGLSMPTQSYELARENLASAGAQALQSAIEGDQRGAAATAGRVQMAQQAGQQQISSAQEERMFEIQKEIAKEDARLQGVAANIELGGVLGAQQSAADATAAKQAAISQAASQVGQVGMRLIGNEDINPLYKKQKDTQPYEKFTTLSSGAQVNNKILDGIINPNQRTGLFGMGKQQLNPIFGLDSVQNPIDINNMNALFSNETGLS